MQQALAALGTEQRYRFTGLFERYGYQSGAEYDEPMILLTTIRLNGKQLVALNLWLHLSKDFQRLGELKPGDKVRFTGRVAPMITDYQGQSDGEFSASSVAYQIVYPSQVKLIRPLLRRHRQALPTERAALVQQIIDWNTASDYETGKKVIE